MNNKDLVIFHPSPFMVSKLDNLMTTMAPNINYTNLVIPELLAEAQKAGISQEIKDKVKGAILNIKDKPRKIVLCSCSTIGGCAEEMSQFTNNLIIRIDRPMAEIAIEKGIKIGVAAALESTIEPTRKLLESVAKEKGKQIEISNILCTSAWKHWQNGDEVTYILEIEKILKSLPKKFDVIVLAQGSMAPAERCAEGINTVILSSPTSAINRIIQLVK